MFLHQVNVKNSVTLTVGLIGTESESLRTAYKGQNHSVRFTNTVVLMFTVTAMRTPNVTRTERTG